MHDGRCLSSDDATNNDASCLSSPTGNHLHHHWVEYPNRLLRHRRHVEGSRRSILIVVVIMMISSMRMNGARQGSFVRKWWVTSLEIPRIPTLFQPRLLPSHGVATTTAARSRPPRRRPPFPPSPVSPPTLWQTIDSEDSNIETDNQGRLIRRRATTTNDDINNNINNNNNDNSRDNNNNSNRDGWDNFNPLSSSTKSSASPPRYGAGGWVDSSEGWDDNDIRPPPPSRPTSGRPRNDSFRGPSRGRGGGATEGRRAPFRRDDNYSNNNSNNNNYNNRNQSRASGRNYDSRDRSGRRNRNLNSNDNYHYADDDQNKVRMNLRFIEDAGYDHLYGLSSIVHALQANVRFTTRSAATIQKRQDNEKDDIQDDQDSWYQDDSNDDTGDNYAMEDDVRMISPSNAPGADIKPEARVGTFLFVQDTYQSSGTGSRRSNDKQQTAQQVMSFAEQYQIPVHYVNKGVLNTMSSNRPHQGYVLRCPKLVVDTHIMSISKIPTDQSDPNYKSFWLVLDEVVDPQNFGAILRSAYFLGAGAETTSSQQPHHHRMGILICSKNSAPPSAVVSATSAGALELFMTQSSSSSSSSQVYSTNHLIRVLDNAEQEGCRIIGASSSVPYDNVVPLYNLQDIPPLPPPSFDSGESPSGPPAASAVTILVLGSEGHGLRPLVAKSCTEYVRIPPALSTTTTTSTTSEEMLVSSDADENSSVSSNVDSLNVSVTAGILLWHLLQPRTSTATHTI